VNLHGPVRVIDSANPGTATVILSLDAWKEVAVAPTIHSLTVLPAKAGAKDEPVSPNLITSLPHPDKKAYMGHAAFSADSSRLFTTGYPSGVVQIWDVAARREVRRIETPPGLRGSADYALLTPDWQTLYVPVERRSVKPFERDGKRQYRIEHAGEVRVWDIASGKGKNSLLPVSGSAPVYAQLAPGGQFLLCVERPSYDTSNQGAPTDETMAWDLASGKKWKLTEGFAVPAFAPDGKTVAVRLYDRDRKTSAVNLLDFPSGKILATVTCSEKDRRFDVGSISPDGNLLSVYLNGKKGQPMEVTFFDAKGLTERGKLLGKSNPEQWGGGSGLFTPDSSQFVALDMAGNVFIWNVAEQRVTRTFALNGETLTGKLAISPDGKTLAVGWSPKMDKDVDTNEKPDPQDLPQPRISLIDLAGEDASRVLTAPHGYPGQLAFSPDGKTLAFGGAGAVHLFDLTK